MARFFVTKKYSAFLLAIFAIPTKRKIVKQFWSVLSCEEISAKEVMEVNDKYKGIELSVKKKLPVASFLAPACKTHRRE